MFNIAYALGQSGAGGEGATGFTAFIPIILMIISVFKGWLFARIARCVRKSFGLYFVLGIFPIADLIALILLGNQSTIRCPQCAEILRAGAKKCRYCGQELNF